MRFTVWELATPPEPPLSVQRARMSGVRANVACVLSKTGTFDTPALCTEATECMARYACNGSGGCVRNQSGPYWTSQECKCHVCGANKTCQFAPSGTGGTFASADECAQMCGTAYACASVAEGGAPNTFVKEVLPFQGKYKTLAEARCVSALGTPGPSCSCGFDPNATGTFANTDECKADATAKCGWKYSCPLPTVLTIPASTGVDAQSAIMQMQGARSCTASGCSYASYEYPRMVYFPIFTFQALQTSARISTADVKVFLTGTVFNTKNYADFQLVVIPWGNRVVNYPDPETTPTQVTRTVETGVTRTVSQNATILVRAGSSPSILSALNTNASLQNFMTTPVTITPGYQYAIAVAAFIATVNNVSVTWGGGNVDMS